MPWQKIGDHKYYTRKYRIGDYVGTDYIGRGEIADLVAEEDEIRRARRQMEIGKRRRMVEKERHYEQIANLIYERTTSIAKAMLLLNGYHPHKGQWRKKRE